MPVPDYGQYATEQWPTTEKGFAAMVTLMDRDIGRLMALLRDKGVDDNTLVIFTSDNGPHQEGGHDPEFFGSRGGLRGIKRDLYEGGIRVPTIARWPGKIAAGTTSDQAWAFWDFFPTACEAAGAKAPRHLDGISMLPAMLGKPQHDHDYFYWEFLVGGKFRQAVRKGKWKAVRLARSGPTELYDLQADLAESNNVAAAHPEIVKQAERLFETARAESDDFPLP